MHARIFGVRVKHYQHVININIVPKTLSLSLENPKLMYFSQEKNTKVLLLLVTMVLAQTIESLAKL